MPVRESQRALYPRDWPEIRARILLRAGKLCECTGQCGDDHNPLQDGEAELCGAPNGMLICRVRGNPGDWTPASEVDGGVVDIDVYLDPIRVVLTIAHHPDPDPRNCADGNLLALCQRCHNKLDAPMRAQHARERRHARKAAGELFDTMKDERT